MTKILMVCTGNICRSPMAEGLMQKKIQDHGLNAAVDSCGFESFHLGDNPDYRAVKIMKRNGIDISKHTMRLFRQQDFDKFDLICVMDQTHHRNVMRYARNDADRQKVDFIMNATDHSSNAIVPDPYYGDESDFELTYDLLDRATDAIARKLKNKK
jgi:protein-tyrosine phosphatase